MVSIQGEIHSSKNSRQIFRNSKTGAPFVAKSKQSKADEQSFYVQLRAQNAQWVAMAARVALEDRAFLPMQIVFRFRRRTAARFDYLNLAQGLLDAMVKADYLADDSANYVLPVFEPYVIDRENPGCDIWIK